MSGRRLRDMTTPIWLTRSAGELMMSWTMNKSLASDPSAAWPTTAISMPASAPAFLRQAMAQEHVLGSLSGSSRPESRPYGSDSTSTSTPTTIAMKASSCGAIRAGA